MSATEFNINDLLPKLDPSDTFERGGLILKDGTVIEIDNDHVEEERDKAYVPDYAQLLPHIDNAIGTWHTHPGETSNLSAGDWETFVNWPDFFHVIIGTDGARKYIVKNGAVINA